MKLLLDTHIWLWSLLDPERLSPRVAHKLQSSNSELWLSPISLWELSLLIERGRIVLSLDFEDWVEQSLQRVPMVEAPLTFDVARETTQVNLSHRDPADHFLVATAKVFGLRLVTADRRLLSAAACQVLANV